MEESSEQPKLPDFTSHEDIGDYLKSKRKEKYPTRADLSEIIFGERKGADYMKIGLYEKGHIPKNKDHLEKYLEQICSSSEEKELILKSIDKTPKYNPSLKEPASKKSSIESLFETRISIPNNYDHLHGRPGNWIIEKAREGGGIIVDDNCYEAIRKNIIGENHFVISLDEVIAYSLMLSDIFQSKRNIGQYLIDAVKKEEGISINGMNLKKTIKDYALFIAQENLESAMFGIQTSLLLPEFEHWRSTISYSDYSHIPELRIIPEKSLYRTIDVLNAKLLLFSESGYVASSLVSDNLNQSKKEFENAQIGLRDLLIESANYLMEHKNELIHKKEENPE